MSQSNSNVAATISKATGPVTIIRDGNNITVNEGDSVFATDTINTGVQTVELSFTDGASATLSPETTMTVQEFSVDMAAPSFVLNLAQGAMRTISGEVVDQNPDAFKIVTPKATVGIRGTTVNTQVKGDGSEVHAVENLSQGHNVTVASMDGTLITLTSVNQGALISAESSTEATPYTFTPSEMQSLVGAIVNALSDQGDNKNEGENDSEGESEGEGEGDGDGEGEGEGEGTEEDTDSSLELDQSLLDALSDESVNELVAALEDAGIDVLGLGRDLTNELDTVNDNDDDHGIGESDSGGGGGDEYIPIIDDDGFTVVSFDGSSSQYADATTVGDIYIKHRITIENDMGNVTISGDVNAADTTGTTITAAGDEITGKNMPSGTVVGDAVSVAGTGTFEAGSDTVTFDSKTGGHSIYGDVKDVTSGTVSFGDDSITIKNNFSSSTIAGDASNVEPAVTVSKWGNDTITISGDLMGGDIYGDAVTSTAITGGNDVITVSGTMSLVSSINGGEGSDTIDVNTFTGGTIDGGGGNDSIDVNTFTGGTINGGEGSDTIDVNAFTGGTINGGGGNDSIDVNAFTGDTIDGGDGSDTLVIATVEGSDTVDLNDVLNVENIIFSNVAGTISGTSGVDSISITQLTGDATITSAGGVDIVKLGSIAGKTLSLDGTGGAFNIQNSSGGGFALASGTIQLTAGGSIDIGTVSGGTLSGGNSASTLTVGTMSSGSVQGGGAVDNITVTTLNGGTITTNAGADNVSITSVTGNASIANSGGGDIIKLGSITSGKTLSLDGTGGGTFNIQNSSGGGFALASGTIQLTAGGSIDIGNVSGGTLSAGNSASTLTIGAMTSGFVQGGSAVDNITVIPLSGGTISTNAGADNVSITSVTGNATITNSSGGDTIKLGSITNGNTLTLDGTGGGTFNIQNSSGGDFALYSGTIALKGVASIAISDISGSGTLQVSDGTASSLTVDSFSGNIIGGSGIDNITIINMTGGNIDGGNGSDILTITGTISSTIDLSNVSNVENITLFSVNGGTIDPSGNTITITNMSGGTINANNSSGNDDITITTLSGVNHIYNNDNYTDIIKLGTMSDNSSLSLNGSGSFSLGDYTIANGTIIYNGTNSQPLTGLSVGSGGALELGDSGHKVLVVASSGQILGGEGDDTITINSMSGGTVDTGAGADSITISAGTIASGASINLGADDDIDILKFSNSVTGTINVDSFDLTKDELWYNGAKLVITNGTVVQGGLTINLVGVEITAGLTTVGANTYENTGAYNSNAVNNYYEETVDFGAATDMFIVGDIHDFSSTSTGLIGGNDTIIVTGAMVGGSKIVGDSQSDTNANLGNISSGNDSIKVTGNIEDGIIYGDHKGNENYESHGDGNDTIEVIGNLSSTAGGIWSAGIYAGHGHDKVTLDGSIIYGVIEGQDGDDTITITGNLGSASQNGYIFSDDEDHSSSTMTGNDIIIIQGTASGDVASSNGSRIESGKGNDTIEINNLAAGANVKSGIGDDLVIINGSISGGTIDGGDGTDTLKIGFTGSDTVDIGSMGSLGGATISNFEVFAFTSLASGGVINGTVNANNIAVDSMTAGTLNADGGNDSLTIHSITGGTINAGDGNDSITINNMNGGSISSGAGTDTIKLNASTGNIKITDYDFAGDTDSLYINGNLVTDTTTVEISGGGTGAFGSITQGQTVTIDGITIYFST